MTHNIARLGLVVAVVAAFCVAYIPRSTAQNRDRFSHSTPGHQKKSCNSCHSNPTPNWVSARGFPDVAQFPGHIACAACHRADFFRGNKPAFCLGCHTDVGPGRGPLFAFPVKTRSHEFTTKFPHSVHQDIIAANQRRDGIAVAHFVFASYTRADDPPPQFNNCAICHGDRDKMPKVELPPLKDAAKPLTDDGGETLKTAATFFKDMPHGHQTCFTCHFTGIRPAGTDCAGCHTLTKPYQDSDILRRYSIKFDHQQKDHAIRDCMTCHVRISQNTDVAAMKDPDVPFLACVSCHDKNLTDETAARADSLAKKQAAFQCSYCHSTAVGRFPIPASHQNR
ncbi:MAG TPA: hypothetical protein VGO43_04255 [Pyrinomonadaceae bacterium]|jgi:hypothetical protein|nr:hypothetical protein [Pyrinomonadaceae bacterium]